MKWNTQCVGMKDADFLMWVRDRLVNVHRESPNFDYILRLEQIAEEVRRHESNRVTAFNLPTSCPTCHKPLVTVDRFGLTWICRHCGWRGGFDGNPIDNKGAIEK
jgi:hypothetical protein